MNTVKTSVFLLAILTPALAYPAHANSKHAWPLKQPQVTVGAEAKRLIFDWTGIRGATHYQLLGDTDGDSDGDGLLEYRQIGRNIPSNRTRASVTIPVHRILWSAASYKIVACNSSQCRSSDEIPVRDLMLDSIAYFKASNSESDDRFGHSVALSSDGQTLVVSAPFEDAVGSGVNPSGVDNASIDSGAVYVFRRFRSRWIRSAYLKSTPNQPGSLFGGGEPHERRTLSVSGDGTIVAVGSPSLDTPNGVADAGAVHVYQNRRDGWTVGEVLQLPNARPGDRFGYEVDLSADGRLLIARTKRLTEVGGFGDTYVYHRKGSNWRFSSRLPPPSPEHQCISGKLSRDGSKLVLGCGVPTLEGLDTQILVLRRAGSQWLPESTLPIGVTTDWDEQPFAIDHTAATLAVRLTVPYNPPLFLGDGVRILSWNGVTWDIEITFVTPLRTALGRGLAVSGNGRVVAIGDYVQASSGAGVLEDPGPPLATPDGTVLIHSRLGEFPWIQIVKAPNPDANDSFGRSLSLSYSGNSLAVGADREASDARGIDGDQTDNSAPNAGAAYLY